MTRAYDYYMKKIEDEFLEKGQWDSIKEHLCTENSLPYTLVIGAGVTACVVGSWNHLLNEVATHRVLDDNHGSIDLTPDKLLDYIRRIRKGTLLPEATDVLEKGEYLRYDPDDSIDKAEKQGEQDYLRETIFARRVYSSILRLQKRQLKGRDYKDDFIDWLDNREVSAFQIPRKKMNDSEVIEAAVSGKNVEELINGLNAWNANTSNMPLVESEIRAYLQAGKYEELKRLLPVGNPEKTIKEAIDNAHKGHRSNEDNALKTLLVESAVYVLWLPDYGTLDALLELCLHGKFRSVLTYNFDTIFEWLLSDKKVQAKYKAKRTKVNIYGIHDPNPVGSLGEGKQSIDVYHVHGILDERIGAKQDKVTTELVKKSIEPIIFSGTSYESYQLSHFNLGSMAIASAWHHGSLLCVGFSGSDANFRSILKEIMFMTQGGITSPNDEQKHEIYITRSLKSDREEYGLTDKATEEDSLIAYGCLRSYMRMIQDYFKKKIGAKIIWDRDFQSMAQHLKSLKKG